MINTLSKINWSKIGWEGGGSTSMDNVCKYTGFFFMAPVSQTSWMVKFSLFEALASPHIQSVYVVAAPKSDESLVFYWTTMDKLNFQTDLRSTGS